MGLRPRGRPNTGARPPRRHNRRRPCGWVRIEADSKDGRKQGAGVALVPPERGSSLLQSSSSSSSSWSIGDRSGCERMDGQTKGRKQAAKSKRRMQAAGVSRVPPGNGRGRRTTTRTIRATSASGVYPGKCFFGPWGHREAPKFSQRHLLQMSKLQSRHFVPGYYHPVPPGQAIRPSKHSSRDVPPASCCSSSVLRAIAA
jgi:hypothetical protein